MLAFARCRARPLECALAHDSLIMPDNTAASTPRYRSPRHWPTWLGLGVMWCIAQLPYSAQLRLGRFFGRVLNLVPSRRRRIAKVNIRLCLPELSARERDALLRKHLDALGMGFVETAMSWFAPTENVRALVQMEGLDHVRTALQQGRGALLLAGHFTTMELMARVLALHVPLHVVYRQHKNPLYQHMLERVHGTHAAIIAHTDLRAVYRALQRNGPLWYSPDQNYAGKLSAFAPFFGVPAATITATARIAAATGAPVIPIRMQRLPGVQGYRITCEPPLQDFPGGDVLRDAARINAVIEAHARLAPEQYLWVHRRFKTRPPGEADVYRKRL